MCLAMITLARARTSSLPVGCLFQSRQQCRQQRGGKRRTRRRSSRRSGERAGKANHHPLGASTRAPSRIAPHRPRPHYLQPHSRRRSSSSSNVVSGGRCLHVCAGRRGRHALVDSGPRPIAATVRTAVQQKKKPEFCPSSVDSAHHNCSPVLAFLRRRSPTSLYLHLMPPNA